MRRGLCCVQALLTGQLAWDASPEAGTTVEAASGRAAAAYALSVDRRVPSGLVLPGPQTLHTGGSTQSALA